jgi:predicted secreted hydrolase
VNDPDHPVFSDLSFSTPKYFRTIPSRFELDIANDTKTMHAEGDNTHAHVSGQNDDYEVDLDVTAKKAAVMHGDHGLVEFFTGSNIYYSTTRMDAKGTIKVHGESHDVTGIAWYDHEYGAQPITNWLWLSIQLDNDDDLMVWRAVKLDGTEVKGGVTYVSPDCDQINYSPSDFTLEATAEPWTSPVTMLTYDQGWHFELPDQNIALDIAPLLHDAEIRAGGSIPYWEVDADVKGTKDGQDVKGYAYSEDVHFAL